ncbi:MAG: MlaD family protein [Pseudomonadota bacterium]
MKKPAGMPASRPPLGRRAWLFGAPAVLGIAAFFLLTASKQGLLNSKDSVQFLAPTAQGMTAGMPVKLNGFVVGAIEHISLLPPSGQSPLRVRVELGIYRNYMSYIPRTTVVRLAQDGLLGPSVIELQPLRYDARPVASGEVLAYERSRGMGEIAEQLQAKLAPVLDHAETLSAGLADPKGHFQRSLQSTAVLMETLQPAAAQWQGTATQISRDLGKMEMRVERSLDKSDHALDALNATLPGLMTKLDHTAADVQAAGAHLRQITGESAQALPGLLDEAQQIGSDGTRLVRGATQSWPMRTWLPPPAPRAIALDSQQDLPAPVNK